MAILSTQNERSHRNAVSVECQMWITNRQNTQVSAQRRDGSLDARMMVYITIIVTHTLCSTYILSCSLKCTTLELLSQGETISQSACVDKQVNA
jgi:hypothetical protein